MARPGAQGRGPGEQASRASMRLRLAAVPDDLDTSALSDIHERWVAVLSDEVAFADRIETRSAWMAGFAGVTLALAVAVRKLLFDRGAVDWGIDELFVGSIVFLVLAAGAAVWALWPRPGGDLRALDYREMLAWNRKASTAERDDFLIAECDAIMGNLGKVQIVNEDRLKRFQVALWLLAVGILATAAEALVGLV